MDEAEPDRARSDDPAGSALPKRSQQHHLEPQLREVNGSGDGTPFSAFTAPDEEHDPKAPDDRSTAAARAAAFHRATGRGETPA